MVKDLGFTKLSSILIPKDLVSQYVTSIATNKKGKN